MSYYPPPGGYPGYPPQQYGQYPPPYGQYPPPHGQYPSYPPQYPPHPPQQQYPPPHQQLAPTPPPVPASVPTLVSLLGDQYVLPYETTLIMREIYNWSRDDMEIMDVTGRLQFKLVARVVSIHRKRTIYDNVGNAVCSTMQKVLSMKATTFITPGSEPSESNRVAEVKKVVFSFTPQAHVYFRGNKSSNPDIMIRGNFMERSFQICNRAGNLLAEATRDVMSAASRYKGLDTYYLRIFPGVDTALMVCLVTIIEEVFVEKTQNEGTGWVN